jgi:hypothetical protein
MPLSLGLSVASATWDLSYTNPVRYANPRRAA